MRKTKPATYHKRACRLLGVDPQKVRLVGPTEAKQLTGRGVGSNRGIAFLTHNLVYVNRKAGFETYLHELLHLLFPSRPHWWIYGAAYTLAGVTNWHLPYRLRRSPETIQLPSRQRLRVLARHAARRKGLSPDEEDTT